MNERMPEWLARQARSRGEKLALVVNDRCWTFRELDFRVARTAGALRERGVQPGDRVGLLAQPGSAAVTAVFAVARAGGVLVPLNHRLTAEELAKMMVAMRERVSFGRQNELAVYLLLALCVRKMELLSAQWQEFDLAQGVWSLQPSRTKRKLAIDIPLAPPVLAWLAELKVFAAGSAYLFPARRLIHTKQGLPRQNRYAHVSPDTLNAAVKRLDLKDMAHFTVHDMRRTARTHLAALGVGREVAERALNHKVRDIEGVYNQYDYFDERQKALGRWAEVLASAGAASPVVPMQGIS
jgi:integrase